MQTPTYTRELEMSSWKTQKSFCVTLTNGKIYVIDPATDAPAPNVNLEFLRLSRPEHPALRERVAEERAQAQLAAYLDGSGPASYTAFAPDGPVSVTTDQIISAQVAVACEIEPEFDRSVRHLWQELQPGLREAETASRTSPPAIAAVSERPLLREMDSLESPQLLDAQGASVETELAPVAKTEPDYDEI